MKSLSILTSADNSPQVKVFNADGTSVQPRGAYFHHKDAPFETLDDLHEILSNLTQFQLFIPAARNAQPSLRVDGSVQCTHRTRVDRATGEKSQFAFFEDRPAPTITFDVDELSIPDGMGWHDVGALANWTWEHLVQRYSALQGVGCVWVRSGSAGIGKKAHLARFHFHVILNEPLLEHDRKAMLAEMKGDVDQAMSQIARKHFEAGRVCNGFDDPLLGSASSGVISGTALFWQPTPKPVKMPGSDTIRLSSETTDDGRAILTALCRQLSEAPEGNRHHTVRAKTFTIGGYVGGGHIAPDEAKAAIYAAIDAWPNADYHTPTIEEMFEDGIDNPLDPQQRDLASEFSGGSPMGSDWRPAGAVAGGTRPLTPVEVLKDAALTTTADNEQAVAEMGKRLAEMPRSARNDVMAHAMERNPVTAEAVAAELQSHLDDMDVELAQTIYAENCEKYFDHYIRIKDGGGATGETVYYNRKTRRSATAQAFALRYNYLTKMAWEIQDPKKIGETAVKRQAAATYWMERDSERQMADVLEFNPNAEQRFMDYKGRLAYNTFNPPSIPSFAGDVSGWLDYVEFQIPNDDDRLKFHTYLALLAQRRGQTFGWAMGLVGPKGAGKSTAIEIARLVTDGRMKKELSDYTHPLKASKLGAQFNSAMDESLLVYIHEMEEAKSGDYRGRIDRATAIKNLITDDMDMSEAKGKDEKQVIRYFNVIAAANPVALPSFLLEPDERRWMMIQFEKSKEQIAKRFGGDFFARFWQWMKADGRSTIVNYYQNFSIPLELDPANGCGNAPKTSVWGEMVADTHSDAEQLVLNVVDDGDIPGFKGGWLSTAALSRLALDRDVSIPRGRGLAEMLKRLGFGCLGRARNTDGAGETKLWKKGWDQHNTRGRCSGDWIAQFNIAQDF